MFNPWTQFSQCITRFWAGIELYEVANYLLSAVDVVIDELPETTYYRTSLWYHSSIEIYWHIWIKQYQSNK